MLFPAASLALPGFTVLVYVCEVWGRSWCLQSVTKVVRRSVRADPPSASHPSRLCDAMSRVPSPVSQTTRGSTLKCRLFSLLPVLAGLTLNCLPTFGGGLAGSSLRVRMGVQQGRARCRKRMKNDPGLCRQGVVCVRGTGRMWLTEPHVAQVSPPSGRASLGTRVNIVTPPGHTAGSTG